MRTSFCKRHPQIWVDIVFLLVKKSFPVTIFLMELPLIYYRTSTTCNGDTSTGTWLVTVVPQKLALAITALRKCDQKCSIGWHLCFSMTTFLHFTDFAYYCQLMLRTQATHINSPPISVWLLHFAPKPWRKPVCLLAQLSLSVPLVPLVEIQRQKNPDF